MLRYSPTDLRETPRPSSRNSPTPPPESPTHGRTRSDSVGSNHSLKKKRSNQVFERLRSRPTTPRQDSYESDPEFGCRDRNAPELGRYRYNAAYRVLHAMPPSPPETPRSARSSVSIYARSPQSGPISLGAQVKFADGQVTRTLSRRASQTELVGLARKQDFVVRQMLLTFEQQLHLFMALNTEQLTAFCEAFDTTPREGALGNLRRAAAQIIPGSCAYMVGVYSRRELRGIYDQIWREPDGNLMLLRFLRYALTPHADLPRPPTDWPALRYNQLTALVLVLEINCEQAGVLSQLRRSTADL